MLDQNIKTQLKAYLERLESPIELVAALDESDKAAQIKELVTEIAELSDKVTARFDGNNTRRPSFGVAKAGEQPRVFFAGLPMGHEFTSLILALLQVSGYAPKVSNEVLNQIKGLNLKANFDVFVSLSCHNCPDVVQALNLIAIYNPNTTATMIDGAFFQDEVEQRKIMAVPMVFQDNEHIGQGRMTLEEIVAKLDTNSAEKDAAALNAKDAFDVLVIGAFVEARSCERFYALASRVDDELARYYRYLLKSESRHFEDYLALAMDVATTAKLKNPKEDIQERILHIREVEKQLILAPDETFRFHSGIPAQAA